LTLRRLQVALGMIWLLDAGLQYQPFMFSRGFADTVVLPSARHNPAPIAGSVTWAAHQILARPVLANAAFATAQLVLALGILWRPTVRIALAASIGWSLGVWWFGEGLGGVLTDHASPLNGAPGAAVLYALAAILLWPRHPGEDSGRASRPPGRATRLMWVLLWGSLSYLALEPTNRSPGSVRATIASTAAGEPQFIRALDHAAATLVAGGGTAVSIGFGLLLALSATAVLLPGRLERIVLACSIAPALLIASVGENLGGILTGTATDPSTGPPLILVALGFLNASERAPRIRRSRGDPGPGRQGALRGDVRRGRVSSLRDGAHAGRASTARERSTP
jgi:hypothetical protein